MRTFNLVVITFRRWISWRLSFYCFWQRNIFFERYTFLRLLWSDAPIDYGIRLIYFLYDFCSFCFFCFFYSFCFTIDFKMLRSLWELFELNLIVVEVIVVKSWFCSTKIFLFFFWYLVICYFRRLLVYVMYWGIMFSLINILISLR